MRTTKLVRLILASLLTAIVYLLRACEEPQERSLKGRGVACHGHRANRALTNTPTARRAKRHQRPDISVREPRTRNC